MHGKHRSRYPDPAQRLHFDIYGFVLLENVLTPDEVARMKDALHRMKADPDLKSKRVYAISVASIIYCWAIWWNMTPPC